MHYRHAALLTLTLSLSGCSGSSDVTPAGEAGFGGTQSQASAGQSNSTLHATGTSGGTRANTGGIASTGGAVAQSGGSRASGGASTTARATGGAAAIGGSSATRATGGNVATGGTQASAGRSSTGGTQASSSTTKLSSTGGRASTGGTLSTGGSIAAGGTRAAGGSTATAASSLTGGSRPTGGSTANGGATSGGCDTPPAASELVGWAAVEGGTTGGGNTTPTVVTTLTELQNAVKGTTPAVIHVKGVLSPGVISIGSNKTIVGLCGAEIHGHIGLSKSSNVIIRNIKIVGYAVGDCSLDPNYDSGTGCSSGEDAITLQGQSTHVWFDHDDISDGTDGNLDITHGSDYITISWTKFHYTPRTDNNGSDSTGASGHRYSNLIGGSDSNGSEDSGHLRVTWHHNWWADNVVERQPRVRFGQVHLFNNLWSSSTANYCIGLGVSANVRTENNVFIGVKTPLNTTSYSDSSSAIRSTGNLYTSTSGSAPTDVNASNVFNPATSYTYALDEASGLQATIQNGVGPK